MPTYITSDNHIDDPIMLKYRPWFKTMEEHNDATWRLLDQLKPTDQLICLGDGFLTKDALDRLSQYPFEKMLFLGNHEFDRGLSIKDFAAVFDEVSGDRKVGNLWFSHIPMHPMYLKGKRNVHGHNHNNFLQDGRYVNVTLEATCFRLLTIEEATDPNYRPFRLFATGEYGRQTLTITNGHVEMNRLVFDAERNIIGDIEEARFVGNDTVLTIDVEKTISKEWDEQYLRIIDNTIYWLKPLLKTAS